MHRDLLRALPRPFVLGVVHLGALPGAPRFGGDLGRVLADAARDAEAYRAGGVHGLVVENFGDVPFHGTSVPPETIAAMAVAAASVRAAAPALPLGVNVLRNDARAALGLCAATGAKFVRVNVHTGAAVTDQGIVQGQAAETVRERARLCPGVALLCDVHVKHASPLAGGTIETAAQDTLYRGMADALIVSGSGTGSAPDVERVAAVRRVVGNAPVLIGSGLDEKNAGELLAHASGAIVGTALKRSGRVDEPVDVTRVERMRRLFDSLKERGA